MKRIPALLALPLLLTACSVHKVETQHRQIKADQKELQAIVEEYKQQSAMKPRSRELTIDPTVEWTYKEVSVTTSKLGIRESIQALSQGYPVVFSVADDFNPKVSSSRNSKTIRDHFESYEMQANVGIVVTAGAVIVQPNKTVHYEIPVAGGFGGQNLSQQIYNISADNLQQSESAENVQGFSNRVSIVTNAYEELSNLVKSAVPGAKPCLEVQASLDTEDAADKECYAISGTGNMLTITAKPQDHARFRLIYENWNAAITRQASVSIKVMEIDVTDLAQQQFDITLIRNSLVQTQFINQTSGLVDVVDAGGFLTFDFQEQGLYETGTQGVIQALNRISDVSLVSTYDLQLHNNKLRTIRNFGTTRFPQEVTIQNTSGGAITTSTPSVKIGQISTGDALNILPTITQDTINLHIVANDAQIEAERPFNFGDGQLQGVTIDDSGQDEVLNVTLKSRQMVLLSSSQRKEIRVVKGSSDFAPIVGDTRSGEKRIIERIFLISGSIKAS